MKIKILEKNLIDETILITRIDNGYINPKGWLFPCLICSAISSRIQVINTIKNDGIIKSFICKDCKNKEYLHTKSYSYYLKYYNFYRLKKVYSNS